MVIVGPGYGGAVAAVRLAQNGIQVCVLERGKEYLPGDFPSQFGPLVVSAQIHIPKNERPIGPQDGLFHVETGQGISALVGCARGGTSQINAGVVAAPEEQIFEGSHWRTSFVKDRLDYFKKVKTMLGANPHPSASKLPKVQALQRLAEGVNLGERFSAPDIAVTFEDGLNGAGFKQFKCLESGECVTGCKYGAKNTLTTNYLPFAKTFGAESSNESGNAQGLNTNLWRERKDTQQSCL